MEQLEDQIYMLCVSLVEAMIGDVNMMGHFLVDLYQVKGSHVCLAAEIEVEIVHPSQDVPSFTPKTCEGGISLLRKKEPLEYGCKCHGSC
jgi:hypothetical protein